MRSFLAIVSIASLAAFAGSPAFALDPPKSLTGTVEYKAGMIAGQERHYIIYVPKILQPNPPILIAFHGGGGDGPIMREGTGFEFDALADEHGFVVIYPYGVGQSWTTCRKGAFNKATEMRANDIAFVEAMIAYEVEVRHADKSRVYITGHSNGGQLSFKLALERPELFAGIATTSSSLPTRDNMSCGEGKLPIPVFMMNGTDDPVVPYRGGRTGGGTQTQGNVISVPATAQYFAALNGDDPMPETVKLPHLNDSDPTWVERSTWSGPGKPGVVLYTIHTGGHLIPQPYYRYPTVVGRMTKDVDAPTLIWDFFSKLPPRSPSPP
jgi:polyhydroxybutyrate depolymerase